jgi:hypothetical protein
VLGSLEVVITNQTQAGIPVASIQFLIPVGSGAALMPSTQGVLTAVSNSSLWTDTPPASPVTSGTAVYTLGPVTGAAATLESGDSVVVQIFQFATVSSPGTTTISVKESIANIPPASLAADVCKQANAVVGLAPIITFTGFQVTTFPPGFYFGGLVATVENGSLPVPVAQVASGQTVTLMWNASVADSSAYSISYATTGGQQTVTPAGFDEWTSPPLKADTVFTVTVTVAGEGGAPQTASLAVPVGVQNPALVAASLTAGTVMSTGEISATGVISAGSAIVSGELTTATLTAGAAQVANTLTAGSAQVTNALTAGSAQVTNALTAGSAQVTNALTAGSVQTSGSATIAGWLLQQDDAGDLVFSYNGKSMLVFGSNGLVYVGGKQVLLDQDPIHLKCTNRDAMLNATSKFGGGGSRGYVAAAYWTNDPDYDSNLQILWGSPYS